MLAGLLIQLNGFELKVRSVTFHGSVCLDITTEDSNYGTANLQPTEVEVTWACSAVEDAGPKRSTEPGGN